MHLIISLQKLGKFYLDISSLLSSTSWKFITYQISLILVPFPKLFIILQNLSHICFHLVCFSAKWFQYFRNECFKSNDSFSHRKVALWFFYKAIAANKGEYYFRSLNILWLISATRQIWVMREGNSRRRVSNGDTCTRHTNNNDLGRPKPSPITG